MKVAFLYLADMKLAFLHARQDPKYAVLMVESVKRHMPQAEIIQLTDLDTDPVWGVDQVMRRPWHVENPIFLKMEHLAELEGEVLVLDTDVIVQADLSPVFGLPFDMALTWRDGPIYDEAGNDVAKLMPYNCGVMFQRNKVFWSKCLEWCAKNSPGWYGDQLSAVNIAPQFNVLRLHCNNFNYTPRRAEEDVSMKYAVHYKGKSRKFMDQRFGL